MRQNLSPPQRPLCVHKEAGEREKRKRAGDDGKGKEKKRDSHLFSFPIFPSVLAIFRSLLFLLGYPVEATLCGRERDKPYCRFA